LTDLEKIGLKGQVKRLKFESISNGKKGELTQADYEGEGTIIDNEFFFNKNGMISEQRQYSSSELSLIFVFEYDEINRLISKKYYNSSNELVMKSKFKNIINSKGKLIRQLEFRATENSMTESSKIEISKKPYETIEFSYSENGELIKMIYIQSIFGPDFPRIMIEYKNGLMIKQSTIDFSGEVIQSSEVKCLELDKNGNCTKLKTKDNNPSEEYTIALIEYYK
jgi:hypothetical protein